MKFQPGQSGNPAGRPLGSRNKKTIAMEEEFGKHAEEAVEIVMRRARGGDPTCLRLLMARVMPTGIDRPLTLELPEVNCADDAQKALNMVVEAFGRGAITVREFPPMLGSVDRMARIAERIQQNRENERERYGKQRVHGVHPDMIPKAPPGWTDPDETLKAAIERGENPWPDDPAKLAYVLEGEELFPTVHSDGASLVRAAGDGGEPERTAGEPGGGAADAAEGETLYSPVNLNEEPAEAAPAEGDALHFSVNSAERAQEEEAAGETLAPSLPRAAGEGGSPERSEGEPGGGPGIRCQLSAIRNEAQLLIPDY